MNNESPPELLVSAIVNNYAQRINNIMYGIDYVNWKDRREAINDALNRCRKLVWESLEDMVENETNE